MGVLLLAGKQPLDILRGAEFDWELKAASPPYGGLNELTAEYHCGPIHNDYSVVEVIVTNVAAVAVESTIDGTKALVGMRLAANLSTENATVGCLVYQNGKCIERRTITGNELAKPGHLPKALKKAGGNLRFIALRVS